MINRKQIILFVAVPIVMLISISIWFLQRDTANDKAESNSQLTDVLSAKIFKDDRYGIAFEYPADAEVLDTPDLDKEQGMLFRLQRTKEPAYFLNIRIERELRLPSSLSKLSVLDLVTEGARKSYEQKYENYSFISEEKLDVSGKQAVAITFSYTGPSGEDVTQQTVLIERDGDSAVYISQQARTKDFATLQPNEFARLIESFSL